MPIKTQAFPCNFVGNFKVGDNIVFNAEMLCKLTEANEGGVFNQLIVVQLGSIVEAALAQIIYRAQHHSREGVPSIPEDDRSEIAGKQIDKFNNVIDVLKKYKVLNDLGGDIYDELHKLRKYRNKVHIQDEIAIESVSRDEGPAFSDDICTWAFRLTARVIRYLSDHMSRPKPLDIHVVPLLIPLK